MFENKKAIAAVILYIILAVWIMYGFLSTIGVNLFARDLMVDEVNVDGSDFSPLINLGIFALGGVVSFFAIIGVYIFSAFGSLILVLICRLGLLKKENTQGTDIRKVMTAICIVSVIAYAMTCILMKFISLFVFFAFAWLPFLYFLIVYLPLKDNNIDIVEFIEPDNKFENHN
ncbi:MAG: hypothetical protein IJ763_09155 [Lachnospiraceae bacterium]|nr:hypothetical protein [Lachnospiraceae bacterium]